MKNFKNYLFIALVLFIVFPFSTFSQTPPTFSAGTHVCGTDGSGLIGSDFKCTVMRVISLISVLIPILVALAFVVFFWGLSKFILHSDSQADIQKGKNYMIWGIVALFVLISFRAIVGYIVTDLGFDAGRGGIFAPQLPTNTESTP